MWLRHWRRERRQDIGLEEAADLQAVVAADDGMTLTSEQALFASPLLRWRS